LRDPGCSSCNNQRFCDLLKGRKHGMACVICGPSKEVCQACCIEDLCVCEWRVRENAL
jgi:hypothetical protein